ncbi:MAG TPA: indole-3-glycerol-phosphate synthase TrpC [Clostridiales bacterium]|nr:indole-3-glycerol-phosphate synthase TrpC [Clostridiales bacterium]
MREHKFAAAIRAENKRGFAAVIPDIKCVSPKEGGLLRGRDPLRIAGELVRCGAPVLSVVTESDRFGGSPELLRAIAEQTGVPVLRKDFITDERGLVETAEMGASAVLLICAMLEEETLASLYHGAVRLGLEPLVEACNAEELERAKRLHARIIGINNRDIATLELDDGGPARTASLAKNMPPEALLISESGIVSREDARLAATSGAHAVLVGTALLQANDLAGVYESLRVKRGGDT